MTPSKSAKKASAAVHCAKRIVKSLEDERPSGRRGAWRYFLMRVDTLKTIENIMRLSKRLISEKNCIERWGVFLKFTVRKAKLAPMQKICSKTAEGKQSLVELT